MATSIARLAIDLLVNSTGLQKDFAKAMKPINKFGREMTAIGKDLSMKVTAPIAGMGIGILKAAGDFEAGMNRVNAITGASATEFAKLRDMAKELGATTQFSATEAAAGIEMLAKNGTKYKDIADGALESTLKLSAATGSDLAQAADIATDAMAAFGIEAKNMESAVNSITGVTLNSKFDINEYAGAIASVAGVAADVGVEFDDFNAAIAAMAPSFSSGQAAGTAFKVFLQRLVPDGKEAKAAMESLGLSFFDANGKMDDLATMTQKLQDAFAGLTEEQKLAKGTEIFGSRGIQAAFSLMRSGAEDINNLKAALADTSAADQAAARMEGLNGAMIKMKSALEAVAISIADSGLLEWATNLAIGITDLFSKISKTNPEYLKWGTAIAAVAAAFGPLVLGIGTVASALAPLIGLIATKAGLTAAFTALTGPIGLTAAAVAALGVAYVKHKGVVDEFLTGVFEKMFEAFDKLKVTLNESLDEFTKWISGWSEKITGWDTAIVSALSIVAGSVLDLGDFLLNLWDIGRRTFDGIGMRAQAMYRAIKEWIGDKLEKILKTAGGAIDWFKEKFRDLYDKVVGNSYIPDMVDELGKEGSRMAQIFINPSIAALQELQDEFEKTSGVASGAKWTPQANLQKLIQGGAVSSMPGIGPDQFKLPTGTVINQAKKFGKIIGSAITKEGDQVIQNTTSQYQRMGEQLGESILNITDGLKGADVKFKDFGDSILKNFKGLLGGIEKEGKGFDIGSIFGTGGAGNIFSGAGGGGLGGILGSLGSIFGGGGGGGLGGILGAVGSFIPGVGGILGSLGSLFGGFFADGGIAPANKLSVVGERGPEFIMPKSATKVIPASEMAGVNSGGGGPTIIINQDNKFESGVQAPELVDMMRKHGTELVKQIQDGISRGGRFRQSFVN